MSLTPQEIRRIRDEELKLTQAEAAMLLGVDGRSWRRWEGGRVTMPEPARRLLLLALKRPGVRHDLEQMALEGGC